jgi:hypothetical protein
MRYSTKTGLKLDAHEVALLQKAQAIAGEIARIETEHDAVETATNAAADLRTLAIKYDARPKVAS